MSVIKFDSVEKSYGETTALDSVSLTIESGELFGFLGPNGAGKTTTISILTGQLEPDSGEVSVLGDNPTENPVAVREKLGIVPERESPPSYLTAREYFQFVGASRNIPESKIDDRIHEWGSRLGLTEHLDTLNTDLSRGQQQKVMITQAFLHNPDLVIIDEPLANLDPITQDTVKQHFKEYREDGNTLLISTHHIEVAADICTSVGVLSDGGLQTFDQSELDVSTDDLLDVFFSNEQNPTKSSEVIE